jgi:hypothetical protein
MYEQKGKLNSCVLWFLASSRWPLFPVQCHYSWWNLGLCLWFRNKMCYSGNSLSHHIQRRPDTILKTSNFVNVRNFCGGGVTSHILPSRPNYQSAALYRCATAYMGKHPVKWQNGDKLVDYDSTPSHTTVSLMVCGQQQNAFGFLPFNFWTLLPVTCFKRWNWSSEEKDLIIFWRFCKICSR